jgi:hypothetical protein
MRFLREPGPRRLCEFSAVVLLCLAAVLWLCWKGLKVPAESPRSPQSLEPQGRASEVQGRKEAPEDFNMRAIQSPILPGSWAARSAETRPRRAVLKICAVDAATKEPVTSGQVLVQREASGSAALNEEFAGNGCALLEVEPAVYALRFECPGYLSVVTSVEVASGPNPVSTTIQLVRAIVLRGRVRNAKGLPQPGAYVYIVQKDSTLTLRSGADGEFETQLLTPDIDRIYAFRPPHPIGEMGPMRIGKSGPGFLEITLPPDAAVVRVSGRVLDEDGKPVEGASLGMSTPPAYHVADEQHDAAIQGLQFISGKSDADGRFSLEALPQRDAVLLVGGVRGCDPASESLSLTKDVTRDIHLRCHPTFEVKVMDADGSVVEDAYVVTESRSEGQAVHATNERAKYFAIEYPFRIYAWTPPTGEQGFGVTRSERVESYRKEIVLLLGQGRVDGWVTDETGALIKDFAIRLHQVGLDSYNVAFHLSSEDGSFSLKHLPPGKVSIEVSGQLAGAADERVLGTFNQEVTVVEGESAYLHAVIRKPQGSAGNPASPVSHVLGCHHSGAIVR